MNRGLIIRFMMKRNNQIINYYYSISSEIFICYISSNKHSASLISSIKYHRCYNLFKFELCTDSHENKSATLTNISKDLHSANSSTNRKSRLSAIKPSKPSLMQINLHRITQCCQCQGTSLHLRRHPWTILRSYGTLQNWRQYSLHELSLFRRLC